jgi:pyrroloquinoline quinone biosynthesis protein B
MMRVHVLGSAAGGGFPQWNCNCSNCGGLRQGRIKARARTQSSIAVSSDGVGWVLFNASPDIRTQLEAFPAMQPARSLRDTGIIGIVLIDSQIDHTTGLLVLREGQPLNIYCSDMVHQDLTTGHPLFNVLGHYCGVNWHAVPLEAGSHFTVDGVEGLRFTAVPLSSKAPPYSPHRHDPHLGDNISIRVEDLKSGKNLYYAPGLGKIEPHILPYMEQADCLMVDGTFWRDDEMVVAGLGQKLASDMGHLPQSGDDGMLSVLSPMQRPRKILIHINNSNPILDEKSPERAIVDRAGVEVAYDGMDITL